MTRDEAAQAIRRLGGRVAGSVSSKTDYVVVGEEPGAAKTAAAKQYGVPTLSEEKLLRMLGRKKKAARSSRQGELF